MRIERDKPILDGWHLCITDEITDEHDPILKRVLEELGVDKDEVVVNVTIGRTYIYKLGYNRITKKRAG